MKIVIILCCSLARLRAIVLGVLVDSVFTLNELVGDFVRSMRSAEVVSFL